MPMKHNIGSIDAGVRFVAGCALLFLGVQSIGWWGLLGLVFWLTAALAYCPLYHLLHLNSARWEDRWDDRHHHGTPHHPA